MTSTAPVSAAFARPQAMSPADLDDVERIEKAVYAFPWTRKNFADSISSGYSAWVVRDAGAMLGYCVLMMVLDEGHLLNISVAKDAQGRGVGRHLLDWTEKVAVSLGARTVLLEVRPSNPVAQGFYERHRYERIGVRRNYYPAPDGREDAIVMRKTFLAGEHQVNGSARQAGRGAL
ncbi:ribosomal protein S18-alanine N-acetyltransferase [Pigmentiphaga litoralis]|uniref:[Ribosomal protein bS18]-alanine N-acetyltransferase n=1 Tax=Pigmentiphaga litoralis TaxID=516702 RepID=A0A7Y9IWL8_9BURK|nr:ribosomal protein S18-alanine N-acetyltransferase [Pigmentiphaga litoralis]NYE22037.1 ribosomal-protein-alanine acetyltransferase [Pigmentiphaga litoralis]NYE84348.1 ribosomal-protein-alanine acetyltransferase [Pigmentiphaga litoralis]